MNLVSLKKQLWSWKAKLPTPAAFLSRGDSSTRTHRVEEARVRLGGVRLSVNFRQGTTDRDLIGMILRRDGMYRLPDRVEPKVIFDIGANIGIAALYYAVTYPDALIYCFEPLPQNIELLRRNTARFNDRVRILPYGLSDRQGLFEYHLSNNPHSYGGGGFNQIGHDPNRRLHLPLRTVPTAMASLKIDRVDVFKIDTEGSELAILESIPDPIRQDAAVILGELHGVADWQCWRLLSRSHAIETHKRFDRTCFPFMAIRKDLVSICDNTPASKMAA